MTHKELDFGVFLPIANGGWIISENTPPLDASFELNKQASILAEQLGYSFLLTMMKWRGFGGKTNHWGVSLESMMLMSALAQHTSRIRIWATVHTLLHNPAVAAKMMTTLDHVSNGRAGMNIVAGSFPGEFDQMDMWRPELDHDQRYQLTREWIAIVKRLWSEDRVDFDGDFYRMKDCVSDPKPMSKPHPTLICAGMSEVGLRFTAEHAEYAFVGGETEEEIAVISKRAKEYGAEHGKQIKTCAMYTIIPGVTDAEAEKRLAHFVAGRDIEAINGILASYGFAPPKEGEDERSFAAARQGGRAMVRRSQEGFMSTRLAGSAESLRQQIEHTIRVADLDGMMLIFPDYIEDLRFFGEQVMPGVRQAFRAPAPA
jgi:pyrimidine oxygenase